jgi:3-dehydroquinate synthase
MEELQVETTQGETYPVAIGDHCSEGFPAFWNRISGSSKAVVVIDERVKSLHGDSITHMLSLCDLEILYEHQVPSGEASKGWEHLRDIIDGALNHGLLRNTPVIVIGGGVTGDLGGFAASCLMRGVPLIHIPTTLLAMVDSSIGGKTAINHTRGKNLVGAFYQPQGVWMDTQWLKTLEKRDWVNGMSEILKYGYIADRKVFDQVADLSLQEIRQQPDTMIDLIRQSVRIKAEIVNQDTKEKGLRAVLNFGHTFGHAMEALGDYGDLAHGEAVYAGMIAALEASNIRGARFEVQKLLSFKDWYDIRINHFKDRIDELIALMKQDKKSTENGIRLVLVHDWARPYVAVTDEGVIRTSFQRLFEHLS